MLARVNEGPKNLALWEDLAPRDSSIRLKPTDESPDSQPVDQFTFRARNDRTEAECNSPALFSTLLPGKRGSQLAAISPTRYDTRRTAAPFISSCFSIPSATLASDSPNATVWVRTGTSPASLRNSCASARVFAVTLRISRS
jgi:hypothetical protein